MGRRLLPLLLIGLALLSAGCNEAPQLAQGQPVPEFTLPRLGGEPLPLAATRGQVVAVRFWADWCPYCAPEMRDIEPIYQRYRDQGLTILAINVRQDRATAQAFIDSLHISYDVLLDESGEVARRYGVMGLPITFFLDRQGRLHNRILGESTPAVFERVVQELIAPADPAQAPAPPATPQMSDPHER